MAQSDPEADLQKPQVVVVAEGGVHPGGVSQGMRKELRSLTSPILQEALAMKTSLECLLDTLCNSAQSSA